MHVSLISQDDDDDYGDDGEVHTKDICTHVWVQQHTHMKDWTEENPLQKTRTLHSVSQDVVKDITSLDGFISTLVGVFFSKGGSRSSI